MDEAVKTLELLLRKTEETGGSISMIYPEESEDFLRGYINGQIDAYQLALEHIKDIKERCKNSA